MSAWTSFVTKYYKDKKRTNPSYQFKSAMKDAAKVYKKTPSAEGSTPSSTRKTSRRSMSRKSRSRRTRRSR